MSIEQEKFGGGVAVVTGAGAGIGMGFARRFAALGMTVIVTDVSAERAETVAGEIGAKGGKAEAMVVDVSRAEELDRLAAHVFDRHGGCRVLINNAGIETIGNTWEISAARWDATLNINIHGIVHGCRAFIPYMLKAGEEAWIGNLGSIGSFGVMPEQTAYIMSKHAVQSFTECLYLELERTGAPIHVSSILPGMLKTSIFDAADSNHEPSKSERHRTAMREMMAAYGMDLDQGVAEFVRKMAEGRFWADSQPEMTRQSLDTRIEFLQTQRPPQLAEQARHLLD
ncbi:SDR family NAD(P)-dependent oxidoreductase [Sphingomonas jatrophae]|uniref:Short-chain dehydrogenase n=1 Tax=Sphingomonas jatrophae TaxID=1166337 RepID=A0A1I6KL27_9SPHN|nr:SDR family NAD(P)-dependent oxidoreductase [Sphingomonas jatrophae]SFR91907.1 Short-chain dehydrogenase [Sphingomonas jatrophae]